MRTAWLRPRRFNVAAKNVTPTVSEIRTEIATRVRTSNPIVKRRTRPLTGAGHERLHLRGTKQRQVTGDRMLQAGGGNSELQRFRGVPRCGARRSGPRRTCPPSRPGPRCRDLVLRETRNSLPVMQHGGPSIVVRGTALPQRDGDVSVTGGRQGPSPPASGTARDRASPIPRRCRGDPQRVLAVLFVRDGHVDGLHDLPHDLGAVLPYFQRFLR